ncbi:hypothetical protein BLOT_003229 [Blomia tropicalis]|nr:hypothetical protein BLOT_003229 [Blomia tropicalis]
MSSSSSYIYIYNWDGHIVKVEWEIKPNVRMDKAKRSAPIRKTGDNVPPLDTKFCELINNLIRFSPQFDLFAFTPSIQANGISIGK